MINLNLGQRLIVPKSAPRLNTAHPLYSANHMVAAHVASGLGLRDLVTGAYGTNTGVVTGFDENGNYCMSPTSDGTGTINMTGPTTSYQYATWGCIFKMADGGGRQYVWCFGSPQTGLFINGLNISFNIQGGTIVNFVGKAGHTYFAIQTNAVGTAALNRTCALLDMTTGQVFIYQGASTVNLVLNPFSAFVVVISTVCKNRLYAGFATGTVLVPPAVTPSPTFYSMDQIMAALQDPWGLWYA
jgi:hypothetical protein